MGSHPEIPTLPLFTAPPPVQSPDHPGTLTPPLHAAVSVPFRWEEQPGKPRPCTDLIPLPTKCLDPPPRLYLEYNNSSSNTNAAVKSPSPTTVLDGPYIAARPPQFSSSSFRFSSDFDGAVSPERGQLRTLVLGNEKKKKKKKRKWWQIKSSSFIFPSYNSCSMDDDNGDSKMGIGRFTRHGSFSSLSPANKSHFWATIYQGVKQVMPWKCKKSKKEGFVV